jgi:hypothetical protein
MAIKGDIFLGLAGSELYISPYGRKLRINEIEHGREDTTIGGGLQSDVRAIKYTFEMPYSTITGDALDILVMLRKLHTELTLLVYLSDTDYFLNDLGVAPKVKMEPFSRERVLLAADGLWSDLAIMLKEV